MHQLLGDWCLDPHERLSPQSFCNINESSHYVISKWSWVKTQSTRDTEKYAKAQVDIASVRVIDRWNIWCFIIFREHTLQLYTIYCESMLMSFVFRYREEFVYSDTGETQFGDHWLMSILLCLVTMYRSCSRANNNMQFVRVKFSRGGKIKVAAKNARVFHL